MYGQEIIKPYSSGSRPSGIVNPKAIKSMQEIGYDLSVHASKALSEIPDIEYDLLVTMGCGDECPNIKSRQRQDWDIPDPKKMNGKEFAEIREFICTKVKELINKI